MKQKQETKNLVVEVGRALIAARLLSNTPVPPSHMAIGSGTVAPIPGNTSLGTQLARVTLDSSSNSGITNTYEALFGPGIGTGAITEAGIFNAATAGTMLCRTVFPVVNKAAADSLTIIWNVTIN